MPGEPGREVTKKMGDSCSGGENEIETLHAEIERLRTELAKLRQKNEELHALINKRDFERPPHYS